MGAACESSQSQALYSAARAREPCVRTQRPPPLLGRAARNTGVWRTYPYELESHLKSFNLAGKEAIKCGILTGNIGENPRGMGSAGIPAKLMVLAGDPFNQVNSFFFFFGCTHGIWRFPGQGLNLSCSCNQLHSFSNPGSLTHCTRPGIELRPQQ